MFDLNGNNPRKEILAQYKEREIIGGVYIIRNMLSNRLLLDASADIKSIRNRFEFARKTGSCVVPRLQEDWSEHGSASFSFEVLEELKRGENQTDAQFKADLDLLREIWSEKLSNEKLY